MPGTLPEPNGTYVRRFQQIQANLAEQDDFVVYLHEWRDTQLGPYGEYHLHQMAQRLQEPDLRNPVVVQVSVDPALNENRRRIIADRLADAGVPNAHARVVLGYPEAEGQDSVLAPRIVAGANGLIGAYGGVGYGTAGGIGGFMGGLSNTGGIGAFGGGGLTGGGYFFP
jgi:hypothetical protein